MYRDVDEKKFYESNESSTLFIVIIIIKLRPGHLRLGVQERVTRTSSVLGALHIVGLQS